MKIKKQKIIGIFLASAIAIMGNSRMVYADQRLPDLTRNDCSITISPKSVNCNEIVKKTQFSAWRVGDAIVQEGNITYVPTIEFVEVEGNLNYWKTADIIEKLQNHVKSNGVKGITQKANEAGKVRFQNIPEGLYLLQQDNVVEGDEVVSPFLIEVPTRNSKDQEWIYHVDAYPKAGENKPNEYTKNPDTLLPKTGQLNWPIPVLVLMGIGFFTLGYVLYIKKR